MSAMPSERFHETLLAQYRDLIQEAFLESESQHRTQIDGRLLRSKLRMIFRAAVIDGLTPREIQQLVDYARQKGIGSLC